MSDGNAIPRNRHVPHFVLRHDAVLDAMFSEIIGTHRKFQASGHVGARARVNAHRGEVVFDAQSHFDAQASPFVPRLSARPSLTDWLTAVEALSGRFPGDSKLHDDLARARYFAAGSTPGGTFQSVITDASVRVQDVITATRKTSTPGPSTLMSRPSRRLKKRLRREAQAELAAVLAGCALVVTSCLNHVEPELPTVARGSLSV